MASSKRKSPKRKKGRQQPGIALIAASAIGSFGLRGVSTLGMLASRHPSTAGGTIAFLVVFSFVAANALWYQHGVHPHPFMRTRDPAAPRLFGAMPALQDHNARVTTFKIERQDEGADGARTTNAVPAAGPALAAGPADSLVMDIQKELIRRGLYNGVADGVTGPRTSAAILFFEETVGMTQKGEATPEVLAALKTDSVGASTLPIERPAEKIASPAAAPDPVAAAILGAERQMRPAAVAQTISAKAPAPALRPSAVNDKASNSPAADVDMISKIQKGLANMAYGNVSVDGVAGDATRQAIKHFQIHYNLPPTGEPNQVVLKKLKDIGAL